MRYGNFNLQRGDHDGNIQQGTPPRWGAVNNPPQPQANAETSSTSASSTTTLTIPEHVRSLQEDLRSLGFFLVETPDGDFGRTTEWAVREFQIYAKMGQVARVRNDRVGQPLLTASGSPQTINNQEIHYDSSAVYVCAAGQSPAPTGSTPRPATYYVDSLESVANQSIYSGAVCGALNAETIVALEFWLENNYRCPVIIEAWSITSNTRTNLASNGCNLWKHNAITNTGPRVYFRDFSNYYTYPSSRPQTEYHTLGYYEAQSFGGPSSSSSHSWSPESEMSILNLSGSNFTPENINTAQVSTYRVIRGSAQAECYGKFDVINCWDNALLSTGPCHWTAGLFNNNQYSNGELPAFLSYFRDRNPQNYENAFGHFGLFPLTAWGSANLYSSETRTYSTWIKLSNSNFLSFQQHHQDSEFTPLSRSREEAHYLKTWHWFFRFSMASRTITNYRHAMWGMIKRRISDIRSKSISFQANNTTINSTIGQIYTSERAIAILLRWHIYRPSHVVRDENQRITAAIQSAINSNSNLTWTGPLADWTDTHETALTTHLLNAATAVNNSATTAADYGSGTSPGQPRTGRNTFSLEN
jgi:peptidoglycan hydrolase-like protein with peptidoglycan-binding domain